MGYARALLSGFPIAMMEKLIGEPSIVNSPEFLRVPTLAWLWETERNIVKSHFQRFILRHLQHVGILGSEVHGSGAGPGDW